MVSYISTETFEEKMVDEHIKLGSSVYSSQQVISGKHLKWKHLEGPSGKSLSINLRDQSGVLVGRSFIQLRGFLPNSSLICNGGLVTDLVIDPKSRNAASLISITKAVKSQGAIDVAVHTSNELSDQIYQKLFKFPIYCKLGATGLPIYFKNFLRPHISFNLFLEFIDFVFILWRGGLALLSNFFCIFSNAKLISEPSRESVEEIFSKFKEIAGSHFERNLSFIKWRFQEGPIFNGKIEWVSFANQCTGYIAYREVTIHGLKVYLVMDVVMSRKLTWLEGVALKFISIERAIKNSCDAIFCIANSNNPSLKFLEGFPFISIPERLLPHPTPIFIHASEAIFPTENRKSIYLTLADLDYF